MYLTYLIKIIHSIHLCILNWSELKETKEIMVFYYTILTYTKLIIYILDGP